MERHAAVVNLNSLHPLKGPSMLTIIWNLFCFPYYSSLLSAPCTQVASAVWSPKKPSFLPREWSSSVVSPHPRLQCLDDSQNVLIQFEYSSILSMSKDLSVSFIISRFVFFKCAFQVLPNAPLYLIGTYCNVPFQLKFDQIGSYLTFGWFG